MAEKHVKLLAKMRVNPGGWKASDFETLYIGFGWTKSEGRDTKYQHPLMPEASAYVSRASGELPSGYARTAVKLIDELKRRKEEADKKDNNGS